MIRRLLLSTLALLTFLTGGCALSPPALTRPPLASEQAIRTTIEYLASDAIEGRGIDSASLEEAAHYIEGYFRIRGLLPPPGADQFFQPFVFRIVRGPSPNSSLMALDRSLRLGRDFQANPITADQDFSGSLAFVGYGLSGAVDLSGEVYDDYQNINVRGRVVLAMQFEPHDEFGRSRFAVRGFSGYATPDFKASAAADHGAVALLLVNPPVFHNEPPLPPFLPPVGPNAKIPVLNVSPELAAQLLTAGGGPSLRQLQTNIDWDYTPYSGSLDGVAVSGKANLEREPRQLENVVGILPGKGRHADEYIVVGAHYDHLGRAGPDVTPYAGEIFHGADDNASGVAALLELARITAAGRPLPRSILFVAFSAEEYGAIGSEFWANHPSIPLGQVKAMLDLDMIGRLQDNHLEVGGTATAPAFSGMMARLRESQSFHIGMEYPDGVSPSDIMPFLDRRIPSLFLWTRYHADYHLPSDTADKINYEGEARIIDLAAAMIRDIASAPSELLIFQKSMPTTRKQP
jgi:hypothetical protein